jgi:Phage capsid protein
MATVNPAVNAVQGTTFTRNNTLVFQKDQWDNEVWRELDLTLVMLSTVDMVPQNLISGKSYKQPKVGRVRTLPKTPGNPVTMQAYKEDEFSMEFKRHMEASIMVEDAAELFLDYNIRSEYVREIAYALSLDVDNWIQGHRVVIQKLGYQVNAQNAVPADSALNRGTILAAKLQMDLRLVPHTDRMWVFSPSQLVSLLTVPEFTSGDFVSGQPTMTGEIGTLYGSPVVINNAIFKNSVNGLQVVSGIDGNGVRTFANVPTPGFAAWSGSAVVSPFYPDAALNGDPNGAGQHPELVVTAGTQDTLPNGKYTGMLVRKGWLKFGWAQPPKSETARETTYLSDVIVTHMLFDSKVYRPENIVLIHSSETV